MKCGILLYSIIKKSTEMHVGDLIWAIEICEVAVTPLSKRSTTLSICNQVTL